MCVAISQLLAESLPKGKGSGLRLFLPWEPLEFLAWGKTLDSGIPCHLVPWAVCLSNLGFLVEVDAAGRNPARCVYEPGHGKDPGRVGKEIDEQSPKL